MLLVLWKHSLWCFHLFLFSTIVTSGWLVCKLILIYTWFIYHFHLKLYGFYPTLFDIYLFVKMFIFLCITFSSIHFFLFQIKKINLNLSFSHILLVCVLSPSLFKKNLNGFWLLKSVQSILFPCIRLKPSMLVMASADHFLSCQQNIKVTIEVTWHFWK